MKKLFAAVTTLMLITVSATMAENIPFTEWLEHQAAVAEQPVAQDELLMAEGTPLAADTAAEAPSTETVSSEAAEEVLPEFAPIGMGSRGIYVEKLQEKLNQLGIPAGKVDGRFGPMTEAALKTVQNALGWEETGVVETVDELNEIIGIEPGDGVNLAMGTSQPVTLTPSGENPWCSPVGFYPTSQTGLSALANESNKWFSVSFDWTITEADTETNVAVSFKYTDELFARVGSFPIVIGDSSGHYSGTFAITDGMRQYGTGWLIAGLGNGNRNMCMTISNFKLERGIKLSEWSIAPEDEGDGINLAMGTAEIVVAAPTDENTWCSPVGFYPTSSNGIAAITNKENPVFNVSFDWSITGADTPVIGTISLKYTDELYGRVGEFPIVIGDSSGHFSGPFFPNDGMRKFGTGWLLSGIGPANRNIQVTISNFKFEIGGIASEWTAAPEDSGAQ